MTTLHIPELTIEGFRGINSLKLSNLGRVTLLSGKNSMGKTTILEAIQLFLSRGGDDQTNYLLQSREELVLGVDEDGDEVLFPDFSALFNEFMFLEDGGKKPIIKIGSGRIEDQLTLELVDAEENQLLEPNTQIKALKVTCGLETRKKVIGEIKNGKPFIWVERRSLRRKEHESWPAPILYEFLGPGMHSNDFIANLWDTVALNEKEAFVTESLRLIVGDELERIAIIGGSFDSFRGYPRGYRARTNRRVVAKLSTLKHPIPLKRLGDGAQRLLGIALALANCRDGILLIDEVENGIHHSLQIELWRMIFSAAKKGNVQVIAATHSWDCISGFAQAANESQEVGTVYRLENIDDKLRAVQYSEEYLKIAAEQKIEVR